MLAVAVLSSALQSSRQVRLSYRSPQGELTERGFDPYGIVCQEGIWYTIGFCHLRKSQRLFRLDRIAQVALTDETFSLPDNFDARTAVQCALAAVKRVWQIEVWLAMSMLEAQRSLRLPQAFFEEKGEGILFRCEVADLPWMAHTLAGLGKPFIIKRPQELREVITQYAQQLANYAQQIDV
jgi:predicted DNA-binding transcriptional regulator YafY